MSPHGQIRMNAEQITIKVLENYATFDISYTFENLSQTPQKVTMGFPQKKADRLEKLYNFKVYESSKLLPNSLHVSKESEKFDWYTYEVTFKPKEQKKIQNSYWVFPTEYRGLYSLFYHLHTGSSWSKVIEEVNIEVTLDASFSFSPVQLAKSDILINPKGYKIEGQKLTWNFKHFKPNEKNDIELFFIKNGKPYAALSDSASSTFNDESLEGKYFGAENLLDGDLNFSWATNNAKGSIGEWVQVDFLDAPHDVEKLGIYPGYGSQESFLMADHLKAATLIFSDGSSKKIYFEEIPSMQFFDINKKDITSIRIVIDEVYDGFFEEKGYKGTAHIGEISIYDK